VAVAAAQARQPMVHGLAALRRLTRRQVAGRPAAAPRVGAVHPPGGRPREAVGRAAAGGR
jgi:hypothetical protein